MLHVKHATACFQDKEDLLRLYFVFHQKRCLLSQVFIFHVGHLKLLLLKDVYEWTNLMLHTTCASLNFRDSDSYRLYILFMCTASEGTCMPGTPRAS